MPGSEELEEWSFLGFTFTKNSYPTIQIAIYYYVGKVVPLYLLIIWFLTCKEWWYHAILAPISMYAFQLFSLFYSDTAKMDENELYYLLLVCMVIIPIVYFIRVKLFDKHVHGIDLEAMDAELKMLQERDRLRQEKEELKSKKL